MNYKFENDFMNFKKRLQEHFNEMIQDAECLFEINIDEGIENIITRRRGNVCVSLKAVLF